MGNFTFGSYFIGFATNSPFTVKARLSFLCLALLFFINEGKVNAQCVTGGQFPATTFTPTCTGTAQTITNTAFAGQYSNVNVTAGVIYRFASSVTTDFITIANGTTPITWGATPLTWTSTVTGIIRFYAHANSSCGTQFTNRSKTVLCTPCVTPTGLAASSITTTSATVTWGLPTGSPVGYQWEVRTSGAGGSGALGLAASGSTSPSFVVGANVSGLFGGTSYFLYVRTDCGSGNFSSWSTGYNFFTLCSVPTGLATSSITASGASISWTSPSDVSPAGYQWEVRTSGAGGSGATGLAASGSTISPTTTANVTGLISGTTYSVYVRTNCGSNFSTWIGPVSFTTVLSCYPPTGLAASSITINSATVSWLAPTLGSPAGYNWEVRTSGAGGSGPIGLFTSGTTVAPTLTAAIAGLSQGTAYNLYVRTNCTGSNGTSTWAGPFLFRTPPVNDLCSAALTLTCNNTVTGTTLGATNDGITDQCGASNVVGQAQTSAGVWYKLTGTDQLVTLSLCGSGYDTRISVLDGTCGSFICVTGNDDYCGGQSQVSFSAYTGHDYYVLVHGFGTGSGTFTLLTTCATLCTPTSTNDNCSTATALTIASSSSYTVDNNSCASVSSLTNPSCGSAFGSLIDVFYTFNSGTNTTAYLDVTNVGVSVPAASGAYYYAIYTGNCTSPTYVSCGTATMNTSATITGLTASTNYILRFYCVAGVGVVGNYKLRLLSPNIWTGAANTDWGNAANWQDAVVPNASSDNVLIPNVTNRPIINSDDIFSVKNIIISSGAILTVNGTIKIAGTVTRAGTFTATAGTVEYNGTTTQSIAANTFDGNSIKNLIINSSSSVGLLGALSVTGTFTPTLGTFASNGFLTIASTATATARIAAGSLAGGYITGNVRVQRYVQSGFRRFRFLSHPFTTLPLTQLSNNIDVTGTITGSNANAFTATGSNSPSAFYFDESTDNGIMYGSGSNTGWKAFTSTSTASIITSGQGIRALIRGAKGEGLAGQIYTPSAVTLSFSGTLKQGNFSLPLNYTTANVNKGWNLVGNPYASNINWSSVFAASTGVNNSFYIYRPSRGSYSSFVNGSGTNGGSDEIEMCSGFFVVANTAGAQLAFTEAAKTANDKRSTMFRTYSNITDRISIILKQTGQADDEGDEIVTRFGIDNATDLFDKKYDAYDLPGSAINLYAIDKDSINYSIFHGTELKNNFIEKRKVKLGYAVSQAGSYSIKVNVLDAFTKGNEVYLKDSLLQTLTLLNTNAEYIFGITPQELQNSSRFSLVFNPYPKVSIAANKEFAVTPNPASDKVQIVFRNSQLANTVVNIIDAVGKIVNKTNVGKTDAGNLLIDVSSLAKGLYIVQLVADNEIATTKLVIQ